MQGYFMNREATQAVFQGDWVKTGDLGYTADGELFVTGRSKDLIIKGGRNLYPQEIEELTAAVPGVRRGCVAAIGTKDEVLGTERLVIVAETREQDALRKDDLASAIVAKIDAELGVPPDLVCACPATNGSQDFQRKNPAGCLQTDVPQWPVDEQAISRLVAVGPDDSARTGLGGLVWAFVVSQIRFLGSMHGSF